MSGKSLSQQAPDFESPSKAIPQLLEDAMPYLRGTTLCHDYYLPFLAEIDKRIGRKARVELQGHFDFCDAWAANLTPQEALQQALEAYEADMAVGHA
jgi:hypothetical protein